MSQNSTHRKILELETTVTSLENTGDQHKGCNLTYFRLEFEDMKISVLFHKLPGYDSHFIMQEISQIANKYTNKNMKGEDRQINIIGGLP